ncbi:MAG: hypothetical protein R3281_15440 [Balneolaceae bacterium]|nr:hypothetical protein [Balneolaceae bacterium]
MDDNQGNGRDRIRQYYRCFKKADRETLSGLLVPDFRHRSEYATYTDREAMLDDIWPPWARRGLAIFGSLERARNLWSATR